MQFHQATGTLYVPDGCEEAGALSRTTHLAIGAHHDDLEIMAHHGIQACYQQSARWFTGVTVTDGGGSPRAGQFAACSDEEMKKVRREEQLAAARLGEYGAQFLLDYPSSAAKEGGCDALVEELRAIILATQPAVLYTHNPADKHATHVGVLLRVVAALRGLSPEERPKQVLGCEVWRDLDWLVDDEKVALDVSGGEELQGQLLAVFASQIAGGKRYDLGALGRRRANATFHQSHDVDVATGVTFAMDLTPLIVDDTIDVGAYAAARIQRLAEDVRERIAGAS
jgi:LmbE family N-acetylglucosaminyl deacetylase